MQTAEPAYIWRNIRTDTSAELPIVGRCSDGSAEGVILCTRQNTKQILADRDFYIYSALSTSTQTTGVREGTAAAMAAVTTCTQGVGFWVTNEGSWNTSTSNPYGVDAAGADGRLYVCGASNNWVLRYAPYTYPHPLQGAASPPAPDALASAHMANFQGATFAVFLWSASIDAAHKAYNIYRCLTADPCNNLIATITPASAAAAHSPETRWIDQTLHTAGTRYYSVSDVNLSDYVGPATTPVPITVTGKQ